jgi:hypothetical protein
MAEAAYREAVRSIESQEASLAELRSRTSVVFAAAALSVSVLGTAAFEDGWCLAEWVGVGSLGAMTFALAFIAWPREWRSRSDGDYLVMEWVDSDDGSTLDEMYRDLAIYLSNAQSKNQTALDRMSRIYGAALALALTSIIAFAVALL